MPLDALPGSVPGGVHAAIQRYFDLMYDCDLGRFDEVFHPTAQLHGVIDGQLTVWPAAAYREVLSTRVPPRQAGAIRDEEILLCDQVSAHQAMVKVRVRIHDRVFIDHLCLLEIGGDWRITSKTFHLQRHASSTRKALSQVQVDDDEVIVTAWSFQPGAETGHHVHGHPYVVVPLTDGILRIGDRDVQLRAGQSYARPAGVAHNVLNRSENDVRFVEIEIKSGPVHAADPGECA